MRSILTVVEEADSFDLTELADVKSELGITVTTEDTTIANWIDQASDVISRYCNRVFALETVSEVFRFDRTERAQDVLILARYPTITIDTVTQDSIELYEDEYEVDAEAGLLYRLMNEERVAWCATKVVVEYSAGFESMDELPAGLQHAAIAMVKKYRASAHRDPLVKMTRTEGVGERQYWVGGYGANGALPPDVLNLIEMYRNQRRG